MIIGTIQISMKEIIRLQDQYYLLRIKEGMREKFQIMLQNFLKD